MRKDSKVRKSAAAEQRDVCNASSPGRKSISVKMMEGGLLWWQDGCFGWMNTWSNR